MKNLQAAAGDMIVTAEVLAIEANTVGTTIQTMTEDIGININVDMNIPLVEEHTHQNTGEEITIMTTNQDQDHQHTLDIKSIRKTARTEEGEIETRLDDRERKDQGTTHLMTARDMKNIKAHIVNRRPHGMKNQQETEVLTTRTMILKETWTKTTTALRMGKVIL